MCSSDLYAADCAPPGMNATTVSVFRMAGDVGYVAGPMLLGFVSDAFGPDPALVAGAVFLVAVGLLFAAFAPETYRGKDAPPNGSGG